MSALCASSSSWIAIDWQLLLLIDAARSHSSANGRTDQVLFWTVSRAAVVFGMCLIRPIAADYQRPDPVVEGRLKTGQGMHLLAVTFPRWFESSLTAEALSRIGRRGLSGLSAGNTRPARDSTEKGARRKLELQELVTLESRYSQLTPVSIRCACGFLVWFVCVCVRVLRYSSKCVVVRPSRLRAGCTRF